MRRGKMSESLPVLVRSELSAAKSTLEAGPTTRSHHYKTRTSSYRIIRQKRDGFVVWIVQVVTFNSFPNEIVYLCIGSKGSLEKELDSDVLLVCRYLQWKIPAPQTPSLLFGDLSNMEFCLQASQRRC